MASPRPVVLTAATTKLLIRGIARRVLLLRTVLGLPSTWILQIIRNLAPKLLTHPQVREILRFIFLGSLVELTRSAGEKAADFVRHFFIVKASFTSGDFAFDWVKRYLEDHRLWDQSRIFTVAACNPALRNRKTAGLGEDVQSDNAAELDDGRPHPVYQPSPQTPELFHWRGHWITVSMYVGGGSGYGDVARCLTLSVWSRNRKILDDFVQEARTHYFASPLPPRELGSLPDMCGSFITARFKQGDPSYDWMNAFLHSRDTDKDTMDIEVTTKGSDLQKVTTHPSERPLVGFKAAPRMRQRIKWGDHWAQFDVEQSSSLYDGRSYGGAVTVTLHCSKREVLEDLILAAREEYLRNTISQVTVHLADRYGSWNKTVTKNRRALNTLILPEGIKEDLLRDAREFLESEEWYVWAGVPHRRGYLLYGEPGTGKSSTIHALASELGLEIYYIQLASQGMDDHNLASLVASTPSRCILLIEDIDCAFPSREDEENEEEASFDLYGNPIPQNNYAPRSTVTLSGLLNVLDSVTSEEGRITFATTNHIERLDPALIRAGRMDMKIEYKLATTHQIRETYLRFFERRFISSDRTPDQEKRPSGPAPSRPSLRSLEVQNNDEPPLSEEEVHSLARAFADVIPQHMFSLAQIQGFLLTKKLEPRGVVAGVAEWVEKQIEEKRKLEELKEKKRQKRIEKKVAAEAAAKAFRESQEAKEKAESGGKETVKCNGITESVASGSVDSLLKED